MYSISISLQHLVATNCTHRNQHASSPSAPFSFSRLELLCTPHLNRRAPSSRKYLQPSHNHEDVTGEEIFLQRGRYLDLTLNGQIYISEAKNNLPKLPVKALREQWELVMSPMMLVSAVIDEERDNNHQCSGPRVHP